MSNHSRMKLGRKPSPYSPRLFKLAKYLQTLPPLPTSRQWSAKATAPWGVMLNDSLGDCTCAGAGHAIQTWSANAGIELTVQDADILAAYEAVGGYKPGQPATDNGCCMTDVLKYWRTTGIGDHRIGAYVSVNPKCLSHVQAALDLFGGLYVGANLPVSAQNQDVWDATADTPGDAGSWGGHCIFVPDMAQFCTPQANLTCITWGELKNLTVAWWSAYVEECYAIVSQDFLNQGVSPDGLNLALLQQDLAQVSN